MTTGRINQISIVFNNGGSSDGVLEIEVQKGDHDCVIWFLSSVSVWVAPCGNKSPLRKRETHEKDVEKEHLSSERGVSPKAFFDVPFVRVMRVL